MQKKKINFLKEIDAKLKSLEKYKQMIKGTVYKVYRKCGNKNCKCTRGELHELFQFNYKDKNNKTKSLYVRKNDVKLFKQYIENYQKAKTIFNEIIELNIDALKPKNR